MTVLMGRLGGLAVALGVGAAMAAASIDDASAAPSDGRSSDSAEKSVDRGPRVSSPRQRSRAEAVRLPDRSPHPVVAHPASATRTITRPEAAEPARVTPTPPATRPRPARKSGPSGSASPTAQSSTPPGRLITIYKGTHFAIPNPWALWVRSVSGDATFIPDSTYDLKDEDQYDWNKLAGITFTPWRPERDASMVVWRYNLQNQMFEVGPFFDVDFAYVFPRDDEVISIPAGQTFRYSVDYDGITVSYGDRTVYKPLPENLIPNFLTSARVTGWFGGSEVAPRTVSYYLTMR